MLPQPATAPSHDFALVSRPGPRTRDALVAVAAKMALADGRAEPIEQRSLLSFLKQNDMLAALGRANIHQRLSGEIDRVAEAEIQPANDKQDLLDLLRPLAGMQAARLVATAAAYVAAADGVLHPAEIELLRLLNEALGLAQDADGALT